MAWTGFEEYGVWFIERETLIQPFLSPTSNETVELKRELKCVWGCAIHDEVWPRL